MRKWAYLSFAIVAEVAGTLALRASVDRVWWAVLAVVAYVAAFTFLGLTLRARMAVGVAYGIWGAVGVALTALLGVLIFSETLGAARIAGIGLVIVGVLLVETGSRPRAVP